MATPFLVANPDTIIVDTDNGQTIGHTQIFYDGNGNEVDIWERGPSGKWASKPLNLILLAHASTSAEAQKAMREGTFLSRDIAPGELVTYGLALRQSGLNQPSFNPNTPGISKGRFAAMLTIAALLKRSGEPDWITDQGTRTGGTFYRRTITTGAFPTYCVMQIGQDKPVRDHLGMFRFMLPEQTRQSTFTTFHTIEATPLLPGTHYYATIRLSNSKGQWSSLAEDFTTWRRRVEVQFHHITIHDDGDNDTFWTGQDDGEVTFSLKVFEGRTSVQEFTWGEGKVSDENGKNVVLFDPPLTYVLGPKSVSPAEREIGVNITGTEDDDLGDEHAENSATVIQHDSSPRIRLFNVPVGFGREQVPLISENVVAHPVGDGSSLHFTVKVSHAIDYVV
jgi:hypothetical protein